ncbi:MAG: sodium-dependent transporter [Candidatus Aminicenantia bacterium]
MKKEMFSSRWGIILAGLGMAIGTGNIWRFPRVLSQNGGGAFIIPWMLFLFFWSIPLLIIEFSIGKNYRVGVIGSFGQIMGKKFAWMGSFVAFVTTAIMFYYSVVTGWCVKYFFASIFQNLIKKNSENFWLSFTSSWEPVFFHFLAILIGSTIIYFGVVKGIERANKILIPSLFLLLIIAAIRALTLEGAVDGLNFLFYPDLAKLTDYKIWLNALSQSAWSTGAGWGLILTYAVYSRQKETPVLTSITIGFGNNTASILAGIAIIPTIFAFFSGSGSSFQKVIEVMEAGNQGLTFIWIPNLFTKVPVGSFFLALFFLTLSFAAFSSLISMIELGTRILIDAGLTRRKAIIIIGSAGFLCGLPSALSMGFFNNQDWVWGLGLMVSGFFFTLAVIKFGVRKFREELINASDNKIKVGRWFDYLVSIILPIEFVAMISWWFWQSYSQHPADWLKIFSSSTVGAVVFQLILAIVIFIFLNRIIVKKILE